MKQWQNHHKQRQKTTAKLGEIFATYFTEKGPITLTERELLKFEGQMTIILIENWGNDANRQFTKKYIYKNITYTYKKALNINHS